MIENLPRFVRVEETVKSDMVSGHQRLTIPRSSILKVLLTFTPEGGKERYVKFKGEAECVFKESTCVKMAPVPETIQYTLNDLKRLEIYPAWIQFEKSCVDLKSSCCVDSNDRATVNQILSKPIQIVAFRTMTLVVAWTSKTDGLVKCAVVPPNVFTIQTLEVQTQSEDSRRRLISVRDETLLRHGLYLMSSKSSDLLWLQATTTNLSKNRAGGKYAHILLFVPTRSNPAFCSH